MKEIKVNMENLSEAEREQLLALLEIANKPQSKVWKPKLGEEYWYLTLCGDINAIYWTDDLTDEWNYASGNCFRTKQEAEFYREKLLVTAELQRFADEHNEPIDWENYLKDKYFICYNLCTKAVDFNYYGDWRSNNIYFSSYDIYKKAIETIGEERIKKYYLGVTE